MLALKSAFKRLAEGEFVCNVQFPDEFAALDTEDGRTKAAEWLGAIGYRLARLSDEGAFFMAHEIVTSEMRARFREELRAVRGRLEPVVGFLDLLRQAQGRNPHMHMGDMIWESEISEAVRNLSILEQRIMDMRDISGVRPTDSVNDRVRRMLDHLQSEGYLLETNPANKGYQITGKIDYLYQLISFISENTKFLKDDAVVDQIDHAGKQTRIDETAPSLEDSPNLNEVGANTDTDDASLLEGEGKTTP